MRFTLWISTSVLLLAVGGCTSAAAPPEDLSLPATGGCGDAYFWAATADGDVAVTVYAELRNRATAEPTTLEFTVPDGAIQIEVLRGENLPRNFCTDLADMRSEPASVGTAASGSGSIRLAPPAPCLSSGTDVVAAQGDLSLNDLIAEDGTTFAPVSVSTHYIGCYSG